MKIAVCFSGLCRGSAASNIEKIKKHFPYDCFYSTWEGRENDMRKYLPGVSFKTYPEPKMHYHPIIDMKDELLFSPKLRAIYSSLKNFPKAGPGTKERIANHTKQILGHAYMLKDLDESYDMIIRARYDTVLSDKVDFNFYLKKSFNTSAAIGFGTRATRHRDLNSFKEIERIYPDGKIDCSQDWGWYLMDPLIFHPRKIFNYELAWKLHENKELLPAENGWYQILSKPYNDNHTCVYGGVQIEKYMR